MLLAVLTTFAILSVTVIYSSIKGAIEVDEKLRPVSNPAYEMDKQDAGIGKSMIFQDYSKSRNIA